MSEDDDFPHKYVRHSKTSYDAAVRYAPKRGTARGKVYDFMQPLGARGATDEEMQDRIPMKPNTQRPRRRELEQGGYVIDSGITRPTKGGDDAVVWIVSGAPRPQPVPKAVQPPKRDLYDDGIP